MLQQFARAIRALLCLSTHNRVDTSRRSVSIHRSRPFPWAPTRRHGPGYVSMLTFLIHVRMLNYPTQHGQPDTDRKYVDHYEREWFTLTAFPWQQLTQSRRDCCRACSNATLKWKHNLKTGLNQFVKIGAIKMLQNASQEVNFESKHL